MSDARKVDPFDIEALEGAINDSATRVSAIWISFLVFSLYLLVAATTVTQRQLLLAEPVKLPVLNIDLPQWGFFFLAPILFVILHIYVLLQVLLLGRTTAAYNAAVARVDLSPEENASLRQRLANTLFAQIFAGSPRERGGFIGTLLRAIVWITLAIGPILILLAFQFSFLAYHSHIATWTHRLLILFELAAFFLIWPLALDAQRDFRWPSVWVDLKRVMLMPLQFFGPIASLDDGFLWLRQRAAPLSACILFVLISLSIATFPGEPHVNLFTGRPPLSVECDRWIQQKFERVDLRFDRLSLPQIDIVDADKFAKIVSHTSDRGLPPSQGERTQHFRDRDLNCTDLSSTDLRRVDLTGTQLSQANLSRTALQGASLDSAQLQRANLESGELQDATLVSTQLQGASLKYAHLQGAFLFKTQFQGADFYGADLQGGSLVAGAEGQGAIFDGARLQGANFLSTLLQGASFTRAQLQGANLVAVKLQGAAFDDAELQGAMLGAAMLQGADFSRANLDHANLSGVLVWRARNAACQDARVIGGHRDEVIDQEFFSRSEAIKPTPLSIAAFIESSFAKIPDASRREALAARISKAMIADPANDDTGAIAKAWSDCEAAASKIPEEQFHRELAKLLRNFVCDSSNATTAKGIVGNWIGPSVSRAFSVQLARGLLGQDGKNCAATKHLDDPTKHKLLEMLDGLPATPEVPVE